MLTFNVGPSTDLMQQKINIRHNTYVAWVSVQWGPENLNLNIESI
jgi:hypothetical protein